MQKITEIRLVNGGVDAQTSINLVEKNMVVNAVNVRRGLSDEQKDNEIQSIKDSAEVSLLSSLLGDERVGSNQFTLVGKTSYDETHKMYLFFQSTPKNIIVELDTLTNGAVVIRRDTSNIFNFTSSTYVSATVNNNLLIWASGNTEVMYTNLTTNVNVSNKKEVTLITEPIVPPLMVKRISDSSKTNILQEKTMQFCIRFKNSDNLISVLNFRSETIIPRKKLEGVSSLGLLNGVEITFHPDSIIPSNWAQIDIVAKYVDENIYYVIKSYKSDVAADAAQVSSFISGSSSLVYQFWGDNIIETLDSASASKLFDSIPIKSSHVAIADNRLLVANNTEGYDTTTSNPIVNVTLNEFDTSTSPSYLNACQVYLLVSCNLDLLPDTVNCFYGSFVICTGSGSTFKMYSLPKQYNKLRFQTEFGLVDSSTKYYLRYATNKDNTTTVQKGTFYNLPKYTSTESLVLLDSPTTWVYTGLPAFTGWHSATGNIQTDDVLKVLSQIHETQVIQRSGSYDYMGVFKVSMADIFDSGYTQLNLISDSSIKYDAFYPFSGGSKYRFFMPDSIYDYGIKYYDEALRSSGVEKLGSITIPKDKVISRKLIESIQFEMPIGSANIPDWAKYYSLTMSKNKSCQRFINFSPDLIKAAFRDNDGAIVFEGDGINNIAGKSFFGLAIPLQSFSNDNIGYEYTEGDTIKLVVGQLHYSDYNKYFSFPIKGIYNSHIIIDSGALSTDENNIGAYLSTGVSQIQISGSDAKLNFFDTYNNLYTKRQERIFATILVGQQTDSQQYEIGAVGPVSDFPPPFGYRYLGALFIDTSLDRRKFIMQGDTYTQSRSSYGGAFTALSIRPNENGGVYRFVWVDIFGRIAPFDSVGQKYVPTQIRWGNALNALSKVNGISSFDASDYKVIDLNSKSINAMEVANNVGSYNGNMLLVWTNNNTYMAAVGKQELYNANGDTGAIAAAPNVINTINQLNGGWGCMSPRSVALGKQGVFWVDIKKRAVLHMLGSEISEISNNKAKRVFGRILKDIESINSSTSNALMISGAYDNKHNQYLVHFPDSSVSGVDNKPVLPSLNSDSIIKTAPNPIDFYYREPSVYMYDADIKAWSGVRFDNEEPMSINNQVYSWNPITHKLYENNQASSTKKSIIAIPFNDKYPATKAPLAIKLNASTPPSETYIVAKESPSVTFDNDATIQVATTSDWIDREGEYMCYVTRDRLTFGDTEGGDLPTFDEASVKGDRPKGKCLFVVMVWWEDFSLTSVSLANEISSGH